MKSGRSGALKPSRLGLSSKANKCSEAETGDINGLTHGASLMKMTSKWSILLMIPAQLVPGERRSGLHIGGATNGPDWAQQLTRLSK